MALDFADDPEERWYSTTELAEMSGASPITITQWAREGVLPGRRVRGRARPWRFPEAAVEIAKERAKKIPDWHRVRENPSPFRAALNEALARSGMTLVEAARRSSITPNTVHNWATGRSIPFRDDLQCLAETVGEPNLVDLIESRHRRIRLRCRDCGRPRDVEPSEVRLAEKIRAEGNITVDWQRGEGQDRCLSCTSRTRFTRMHHNRIKREGRGVLREQANNNLGTWRKKNPDKQKKLQQAATAAAAATPRSPLAIARQRLGQFSLKPAGIFGLCALCHKLLFVWDADARAKLAQGKRNVAKFHAACFAKWQKTPEYRAWKLACARAKRVGRRLPLMTMPHRPSSRMPAPAELAQAYATTVRYFRQHVGSKAALRDGDGELLDIDKLAETLHISRQAIYKRKKRFLDLLPDEATATGQVKRWREVFLMLEAEDRAATASATPGPDHQTGDTLHRT